MIVKYYFQNGKWALVNSTLIALGTVWTLVELSSSLIHSVNVFLQKNSTTAFLVIVLVSLCYGFYKTWPKRNIVHSFNASNTKVTIKVGDIFNENNHIVIPTSNYFDTENVGTNISLKSKMINNVYNGNIEAVNKMIEESLQKQNIIGELDETKQQGKKLKYKPGTTAILDANKFNKIFLIVFTVVIYKDYDRTTDTNPAIINEALVELWSKYKANGQQQDISVPVFGSGLSGTGFSYQLLIQTIIISYALHCKKEKITNNLNIIIPEEKYYPDLFLSLMSFLESIEI